MSLNVEMRQVTFENKLAAFLPRKQLMFCSIRSVSNWVRSFDRATDRLVKGRISDHVLAPLANSEKASDRYQKSARTLAAFAKPEYPTNFQSDEKV